MSERVLELWTIFRNPKDYPGKYVVRKFFIERGAPGPVADNFVLVADTLDDARRHIPSWMTRLVRDEGDEPQIVESWI